MGQPTGPEAERLEELRSRIDAVDLEIVRQLNERAQLVQEITTLKGGVGVQVFDPKREEEILRRVAEENPGPIYDSTMREVFELILHRIRDLEVQRGDSG